jgi:hypothetical protein
MCFNFLYNFCLKIFSFQEEFSDILALMYKDLQVKFPLLMKLEISPEFRKVLKSRSLSVRSVAAELFHADGQTLRSLFSQFWEST